MAPNTSGAGDVCVDDRRPTSLALDAFEAGALCGSAANASAKRAEVVIFFDWGTLAAVH